MDLDSCVIDIHEFFMIKLLVEVLEIDHRNSTTRQTKGVNKQAC
jgi:hypothetical protein